RPRFARHPRRRAGASADACRAIALREKEQGNEPIRPLRHLPALGKATCCCEFSAAADPGLRALGQGESAASASGARPAADDARPGKNRRSRPGVATNCCQLAGAADSALVGPNAARCGVWGRLLDTPTRVRGERIWRYRAYFDHAEGLREAGLSE